MDLQLLGNSVQVVGLIACLVVFLLGAANALRLLSIKIKARELAYSRQVIAALVAAAEQKANAGTLARESRLEWVLDELLDRFPYMGHGQADVLIHGEVFALNLSQRAVGGSAQE